ncbi:hypothetical protein B0B36_07810 [Pseudomonas syringae pv. actinidifoliorum]|nr:hypothetical protein B0B36_07810 [Pseudomonas syringae pv. actinidifoliorum]
MGHELIDVAAGFGVYQASRFLKKSARHHLPLPHGKGPYLPANAGRLVLNAYRIELKGESMRRRQRR